LIADFYGVARVRFFGLLVIGAAAFAAPLVSARAAAEDAGASPVLQGKCTATDKSAACIACAVALARDLAAPAGDRTLTGTCPSMAAGHYTLKVAVPIKLVPATPAPRIFAQLRASFGATAREDASGHVRDGLTETHAVTWSWWGPSGFVMDQATPVTIGRGAPIDVAVKLWDVRYFVPHRTQGPAHHGGELVMQKGELISLERVAAPGSTGGAAADFGAPRAFGAKILAAVVPGRTTKKQVEALLGKPWRTVDADEDEATPESWEYRGKDASGAYRVHVEFDNHGVATLIVKVPDKAHSARAQVEKTPAGPGRP
jgi:hypothetical protein